MGGGGAETIHPPSPVAAPCKYTCLRLDSNRKVTPLFSAATESNVLTEPEGIATVQTYIVSKSGPGRGAVARSPYAPCKNEVPLNQIHTGSATDS